MFDELITFKLPERRRIWKRLITLSKQDDANSSAVANVREKVYALLGEIPVTEAQSRDAEFAGIFSSPSSARTGGTVMQGQIEQWQRFVNERLIKAKELLDTVSVKK
jgi:DNA mismatch repair ATPase MutL